MESTNGSGKEILSSNLNSSSDASLPRKLKTKPPTSKVKSGVDESIGKEHDIFGVDVKSVTVLERGIYPSNLGKQTISLFLEQIDNMTTYLCHTQHRTSESLGNFVEAVKDLSNQNQSKQGGVKDTGCKYKSRKALGNMKTAEDLSDTLSYLLEEHHTILKTFQGRSRIRIAWG